jgi:hypothetical protein
VEGDAVACVAQEGFAAGLGLEDAALAFLAEVLVDAATLGDQPDHAFGEMSVEVVGDDLPLGLCRCAGDQGFQEGGVVFFGAPGADRARDLAGGDIEGGDQALGAVTDVLVLPSLDPARAHRQARRGALEGLDAGHLVDRDATNVGLRALLRLAIDAADIGALLGERRIRLGGQPKAETMRLEVRFFFKKRPTERWDIRSTMPRFIASSASSCWLQWVTGRSLSEGRSQASATIAQICSAVIRAGAPQRGASLNRSTTEADQSELASQRARHPLTVLRHTPSRSAVSSTPKPSPAIKIIRARRASACGVDAQRVKRSRAQRSSGLKSIAAARRGMVFSTS